MRRVFGVTSTVELPRGPLRAVLAGLGPIGKNVADECGRRGLDRVRIVGAIDRDPNLAGKTLGEIWGAERRDAGVKIVATAGELLEPADVAIVTTTSRLDTLEPQLEPLFARGLSVVSSSEELFYPELGGHARAERINALAQSFGVAIAGTGVNPGFVMDVLPTVLAIASGPPHRVRCERYVDLSKRRIPLQKKAGLGMDPAEFLRLADAFQIGHVGLVESLAYLSGQLGIPIATIEERLEPVVAETPFDWQGAAHPAGRVIGFEHQAFGRVLENEAPLHLYLRMSYREADPRDRVILSGLPDIDLTIRPCIAGDPSTAAILVHLAARLPHAQPGLRLAHELALVPQGPRYKIERKG